jgi:hypothetical protein
LVNTVNILEINGSEGVLNSITDVRAERGDSKITAQQNEIKAVLNVAK